MRRWGIRLFFLGILLPFLKVFLFGANAINLFPGDHRVMDLVTGSWTI